MILSPYTHLFNRFGRYFLYNSLHSYLSEISECLYEILHNRDFDELPNDLRADFLSKNILVTEESKYNYYNEALLSFNVVNYDPTHMGLVLVPTSGCNFDCPYCFEGSKSNVSMTDAVQDEIIVFIRKREHLRSIDISWYGGEPLMALDRMKSLYSAISTVAGLEIRSHSLVTNGYLINSQAIEFVNDTNVSHVQITLDGIKEHHNKTRLLKGSGGGTYDRILDGIATLLREAPKCHLSVRVNIAHKNMDDYIIICKTLKEEFPDNAIYIYPGIIREYTKDECSFCFGCLNAYDYFELLKRADMAGLAVNFMPKRKRGKGCMINKFNSVIIGPEGELYKCWNDVNHKDRIVGNVRDMHFTNRSLYLHYTTETTPFFSDKCKDCLIFPTCNGGCGFLRSRNLRYGARYEMCPPYKNTHILEEALMLYLKNRENGYNRYDIEI